MATRLNAPALGIAIGSLWGLVIPIITWLNALTGGPMGDHPGWFTPMVRALDYAFPGYASGFWGGIWGGICGFAVGCMVGVFVATVYNRLATPADGE